MRDLAVGRILPQPPGTAPGKSMVVENTPGPATLLSAPRPPPPEGDK